jgi:hypothetical protein
MIGPLEQDVNVAAITTTPTGVVSSNFYGFLNVCVPASTLQVGKGYWAKLTQTGTMQLPAGAVRVDDTYATEDPSEWIRLELEDKTGARGVLYLALESEPGLSWALSPLPPAEGFDVRFAGPI